MSTGDRMRMTWFVRFSTLTVLALPGTSGAQGSWLPYGTLGASDVAVTPSGIVWLVAREPGSIRSNLVLGETRFFTPRGSPARVAADLNGFPWLVNTDGTLWHFVRNSAGKEDWVQASIKAIDIAVGANGSVWAIDSDKRVVRLNNGEWENVGGSAVRIAVDPAGSPWTVNSAGQVSHWTGNSWAAVPGNASDITVAPDGAVFILGPTPVKGGFEVLRLNGSAWERIVGGGGVAIAASGKAVFVAQDETTNLVLSSVNGRLRVENGSESEKTVASASSPTPSAAPSAASTSPSAAADPRPAAAKQDGSSDPVPSAGTVAGVLGGIGGLLSKAGSAAAGVAGAAAAAAPVPSPGSVSAAVAGGVASGVAGAAASAAIGGAGDLLSGGSAASSGSSAATGNQAQARNSSQAEQAKPQPISAAPSNSLLSNLPLQKIPLPGSLKCPVIGAGATMEALCDIGREALKLRTAPTTDCAAPAFSDARNGGECWTCPASFTRNAATPVDSANACLGPNNRFSVATFVKGCSQYKAPPGYGTPFRDQTAGECLVCPLPFQWSWSAARNLTKGNLAACVGKGKDLLVWKLTQYPESGTYRFMPGLLSIALADPKAVDAFLDKRANGDTAAKRQVWSAMMADPSSSAELKALLFASLLRVAESDSAAAPAREALREFESYMRARRVFVADEALRMYRKAREVDAAYQQAKDSLSASRAASEAIATAATDFKTYAWSSVMPDSAGTAFIFASAALSKLGVTGGAEGVVDGAISSLNVRYLAPVTKALEDQLDALQDKGTSIIEKTGALSAATRGANLLQGADAAMVGSTLLGGAMKISKGVMSFLGKDKAATEYEKYVEAMSAPVRVKQLLESTNPEDRQTLLLYWALATSAHKASDTIGTGAMKGSELCTSDSWTAAQCSSAKAMIAAAAREVGYSN